MCNTTTAKESASKWRFRWTFASSWGTKIGQEQSYVPESLGRGHWSGAHFQHTVPQFLTQGQDKTENRLQINDFFIESIQLEGVGAARHGTCGFDDVRKCREMEQTKMRTKKTALTLARTFTHITLCSNEIKDVTRMWQHIRMILWLVRKPSRRFSFSFWTMTNRKKWNGNVQFSN